MTPRAGAARVLRVISAGAARELVQRLPAGFESEEDIRVLTRFGPVGVVDSLIRGGEPCDVVITSATRFAELVAAGLSATDGSCDLGAVRTALAVRRADAAPDSTGDLRTILRDADAVYCPDLVASTAGAHLTSVLQRIGMMAEVQPRLHVLPHGALAMAALASSDAAAPIGFAQSTEILSTPGVRIVGPLPAPFGSFYVLQDLVCVLFVRFWRVRGGGVFAVALGAGGAGGDATAASVGLLSAGRGAVDRQSADVG